MSPKIHLSTRQWKNLALSIPLLLLTQLRLILYFFRIEMNDTVFVVTWVFVLTGYSLLAYRSIPNHSERLPEIALNHSLQPIDVTALLTYIPGPLLTQHQLQPRHPVYCDITNKPFLFLFEASVGEQPSPHIVLILQGALVDHEGISHLDQWGKGSDIGWSIFFKPSEEVTHTELKEIFLDF